MRPLQIKIRRYICLLMLTSTIGVVPSCCKESNITAVFVEEMQVHGGVLRNTNGLPTINACWTLQTDSDGFQLKVRRVDFIIVENMVTNALGSVGENGDKTKGASSRYWLFQKKTVGVGLLMREIQDGVQINCINKGW